MVIVVYQDSRGGLPGQEMGGQKYKTVNFNFPHICYQNKGNSHCSDAEQFLLLTTQVFKRLKNYVLCSVALSYL